MNEKLLQKAVREQANKLADSISPFYAEQTMNAARDLEKKAGIGDKEAVPEAYRILKHMVDKMAEELKELLSEL